jgi:hypothetical protein
MCGPSIDYPTNYILQDKGTADMEDVERRIRASGNLFWKILGEDRITENRAGTHAGDDRP